ncbi:hypothetical protein JCM16106_04100 [Hydrogenophilus islandicus]
MTSKTQHAKESRTPPRNVTPQQPPLPDPVPDHPLLQGKPEIGRGRFSIVLDAGPEWVFKIVTHPDEFLYYTAENRPQGPHFPIIYGYHGIIGRSTLGYPMHLFEMEKLYPLPERSPAGQLARRLATVFWEMCKQWGELNRKMGTIALQQMLQTQPPFDRSLQEALEALARFTEQYRLLPDLIAQDNLMMRQDGTLVFSDPLVLNE